jgi:hypothetical protein
VANLEQNDITAMLAAWNDVNKDAAGPLDVPLILGRRTGESLESAALANEVYLKLKSRAPGESNARTERISSRSADK